MILVIYIMIDALASLTVCLTDSLNHVSKISLLIGLGTERYRIEGPIRKPKICLSTYRKTNVENQCHSLRWRTAERIKEGFYLNNRPNELRIRLADAKLQIIPVSEISKFNLR